MTLIIAPGALSGSLSAVPSKSDVHRLLICAALSDVGSTIRCDAVSEDIMATANCLIALGAWIEYNDSIFYVNPTSGADSPLLDCGESGSTLRFLMPAAAAVSDRPRFTGRGRLPERPVGELLAALRENGVASSSERLPFTLTGRLRSGEYRLPGNVSSQYITGLLLALPAVGGGRIRLTTRLESASYVDMTVASMAKFGVSVTREKDGWTVPAARYISPGGVEAEGDWSNAAFFLAANYLGGGVSVTGLDPESVQGDRAVIENLAKLRRGEPIDLTNTPDMLPALAVAAAFTDGDSVFTGAARLRIKESDRLKTVADLINSLGGEARETPDGIIIRHRPLTGGRVSAHGDHRIAMAAAIAGAYSSAPVVLEGAEAVNKSYPGFWEDFKKLGGECVTRNEE